MNNKNVKQSRSLVERCSNASVVRPKQEIITFLWFYNGKDILSKSNFEIAKGHGDPLRLAELSYRLLLAGCEEKNPNSETALDMAKLVINHLIEHYQPAVRTSDYLLLKYRNPTNDISAGWWSSMDGFLLPLVLNDAAIIFEDSMYKQASNKAFDAISRVVEKGGSIHLLGENSVWLSEYTWDGMKSTDEYYVLNGHLYALQALYLLSFYNAKAKEFYNAALNGTKEKTSEFLRPKDWALYMLNPSTINQSHYLIFEKAQFDSLYKLTNNDYYREQSEIRSNFLKKSIPISYDKEKNKYELVLWRAGYPNPYNIDIYQTQITCQNSFGEVVVDKKSTKPNDKYITDLINDLPAECIVYANVGGDFRIELFRAAPDLTSVANFNAEQLKYTAIHAAFRISDTQFSVIPGTIVDPTDLSHYSNHQGRLILEDTQINESNTIFGFNLNVTLDVNIGVGIIDSTGKEFFRYYPLLKKGENLIILSPMGFNGINEATYPIKKMNLYFYIASQNVKISGQLGKFFSSSNPKKLKDYINSLGDVYTPHDN